MNSVMICQSVMSSVVDKCVCLYCLKGTKSIIKAAVSDFFFYFLCCSGEVSVSCLQGHALSFTNSTWQLLQHTTSAIKTWAQDLLTRAG